VVYSAEGPDDPDVARGHNRTAIGETLAEVAAETLRLAARRPDRLLVAGGDTSGTVVSRLSIDALEMVAPLVRGSPILRATTAESRLDGLELVLKGGQIGGDDYFTRVKAGR